MIGSLAGKAASPRSSIYNATKFGLRGFAFGLAADLAGTGSASPWSHRDSSATPACSPTPAPTLRPVWARPLPAEVAAAVLKAIRSDRVEIAVAPARPADHGPHGSDQPPHFPPGPVGPGRSGRRRSPGPAARPTSVDHTHSLQAREEEHEQRFIRSPDTLEVGDKSYEIHRLDALQAKFDVARLPYSMKVLLENVLRLEDGVSVERSRRRGDRFLERARGTVGRNPLPAGPRPDAGLHRGAGRGRSRRDA